MILERGSRHDGMKERAEEIIGGKVQIVADNAGVKFQNDC